MENPKLSFGCHEDSIKQIKRAEELLGLLIEDNFFIENESYKDALKRKNEILDELFHIIRHNIESWWD
jgi:hypothetical protein